MPGRQRSSPGRQRQRNQKRSSQLGHRSSRGRQRRRTPRRYRKSPSRSRSVYGSRPSFFRSLGIDWKEPSFTAPFSKPKGYIPPVIPSSTPYTPPYQEPYISPPAEPPVIPKPTPYTPPYQEPYIPPVQPSPVIPTPYTPPYQEPYTPPVRPPPVIPTPYTPPYQEPYTPPVRPPPVIPYTPPVQEPVIRGREPLIPGTTYKGVERGKFRYRSRSPRRKVGQYATNVATRTTLIIPYMIETGTFGNAVCYAAAGIHYHVPKRSFTTYGAMDSVYWSIVDCPHRSVVIEVTATGGKEGEATHANLIYVNKAVTPWEIERFEPHGKIEGSYAEGDYLYSMQNTIDLDLKAWFAQVLGADKFIYKSPIDVCPRRGPQSRSEAFQELGGFCQTWTMLYATMRLEHPNMTSEELLNTFFSMEPKELYEMIQDFIAFATDLDISNEWITYFNARKGLIFMFDYFLKEKRNPTMDKSLDKDISHTLYTLIAKAPKDIATVKNLNNIIYTVIKAVFEGPISISAWNRIKQDTIVPLYGRFVSGEEDARIEAILNSI